MQFDRDQEITGPNHCLFHVLTGIGYRQNISLSRYLDYRMIARKFRIQAASVKQPDLIVASLPCHHLAYEGVRYARKRNIPVLIDVRDLWPDIFIEPLPFRPFRALGKALLYQDFWRLKYLLKHCSGVLAISQGILEWALERGGRRPGKWDRVFFTGYKKPEVACAKKLDWLAGREGQRLAVYIGTFGHSYELALVLEAAKKLQIKFPGEISFVLAGTGAQEKALRGMIRELQNVLLPGWIGAEEIRELLRRAWVGLVPCRSVKGALPNKMFEYLSAGIPVISSLEGEMADAIQKYSLGVNYQPGDLNGLTLGLERLLKQPGLRDKMAGNAFDFFNRFGNADRIYAEYADHLERLFQGKKILAKN